jgi:hypothetical protein
MHKNIAPGVTFGLYTGCEIDRHGNFALLQATGFGTLRTANL